MHFAEYLINLSALLARRTSCRSYNSVRVDLVVEWVERSETHQRSRARKGGYRLRLSPPYRFRPPAERTQYLSVDAAHAGVFDFEEFLDLVFRAFAAHAVLFHTAERGDLDRDDALVDADEATFEPLGDAPDATDLADTENRPRPNAPRTRER
jgi:hypothetical protein